MKRVMKISISLILIVALCVTFTYAWTSNRVFKDAIDADTEGVSFVYHIGNDNSNNPKEYEITNLTFFDIDDESELKYLNSMAFIMEVTIINTSNKPINLVVSQDAPQVSVIKDGDIVISQAYVQCIMSETSTVNIESASKISDLITETNTVEKRLEAYSTTSSNEIASNCQTKAYIFVFGVQTIKSADNAFLSEKYPFTFNIHAQVVKEA